MRRKMQLGVPAFKTPLTMRLLREFNELQILSSQSTIFEFKTAGDPPDLYECSFHGKCLVPAGENSAKIGHLQKFRISLGSDFPRRAPSVEWQTPIVHPNIDGGRVCMGNFASNWTPNFKLADLCEVLWDMVRFAIFNPHSAYSPGTDMTWEELDKKYHFPLDRRPLRDKLLPNDVGSSIVRPEGEPADIVIMDDDAGGCLFIG